MTPIRSFFFLCFAIGIAFRWKIFTMPVREGDEQIYKALVEYVLAGLPYSMRTHPLVTQRVISSTLYDSPVFFHPPGGIYFFALFAKLGHLSGLKVAQLVCFTINFWSLYGCVREAMPTLRGWRLACLAPLFAFTPIIAHINLRIWIDNPKVAFFTLFLYLALLAKRFPRAWWAAGAVGVLSVLTKVDSLAGFPFALLLALYPEFDRRTMMYAALVGAAALFAAFVWSFHADTLFHAPSMPTPSSLELNRFSWETTVEITPAEFVLSFFKVVTSLVPAALALFMFRKQGGSVGAGEIALLAVLSLVLVYYSLSVAGYAKLLRYLCLSSPFAVLVAAGALDRLDFRRRIAWPLALLLFLGIAAEVGQGVNILVNKPRIALVEPEF